MTQGDRIRSRRLQLRMTLENLASRVGVTRQTLSRYETGVIRQISDDMVEKLAAALWVNPSYLKGWSGCTVGEPINDKKTPDAAEAPDAKLVEYLKNRGKPRYHARLTARTPPDAAPDRLPDTSAEEAARPS